MRLFTAISLRLRPIAGPERPRIGQPIGNNPHTKKPPQADTGGFVHPSTPSGWAGGVLALSNGDDWLRFRVGDCAAPRERITMNRGLVLSLPEAQAPLPWRRAPARRYFVVPANDPLGFRLGANDSLSLSLRAMSGQARERINTQPL